MASAFERRHARPIKGFSCKHARYPSTPSRLKAIEVAALKFGVQVDELSVEAGGQFGTDTDAGTGLIVLPSPFTPTQRDALIKFSVERRVPAVFPFRYFANSWRADVIWSGCSRSVPRGRRVCRSHSKRRTARRLAGPAADEIRIGGEHQHR